MRVTRSSDDGAAPGKARLHAGARGLDEALAPAAMAFPERRPPADLWRRIEAAVNASDAAAATTAADLRREQGWRQYSRDVQIKRLWDENTFLLRCAPGGRLAPHKHPRF